MKKVVRILLAILMVMCLTLGITACKSDCDKGDHKWDEGTVTKNATCAEAGEKTFKCTVCDQGEKKETIPATGNHTPENVPDVPATCTTPGKTGATKCKVCGTPISAGTAIPAKNHDYAGQPWLTNGGKHYQECKNGCGAKNEHTIGMGDWNVVEGNHVQLCTAAGCSVSASHAPNFGSKYVTSDAANHYKQCADCTLKTDEGAHDHDIVTKIDGNDKQHSVECSVCGRTENADHNWILDEENVVAADCTNDGNKPYACECGATKNETETKLGHDMAVLWSTGGGKHWHECKREGCNHIEDEGEHTYASEESLRCSVCKNPKEGVNFVLSYGPEDNKTEKAFETLAAAIASVHDDTPVLIEMGTIENSTVRESVGIVIPSGVNITINLKNKTYVVASSPVGSNGTETNGFQILAGSNVTLMNGTIKSKSGSGVKMLVNNYANLTLNKITLDGSDLDEAKVNYTLSNNCGEVVMTNHTKIIARKGTGVAFDVYYNLGGWYPQGVGVTVEDEECTIDGIIEYGSDQADVKDLAAKAALTLPAGNYSIRFSGNADCETAGITIGGERIGHDFGEWNTAKEPSCKEEGESVRTCSVCGKTETKTLDRVDHTEETIPAVAATCTATGLTEGKKCSVCGEILVAQTETEALGHEFGDWVPSAADATKHERTCSRADCNEKETKDHVNVDGKCECGKLFTEFDVTDYATISASVPKVNDNSEHEFFAIGVITKVENETYGNMTIKNGNETLYVYGLYDKDGKANGIRYDAMDNKPQEGDVIVVWGKANNYQGKVQLKDTRLVQLKNETLTTAAYVLLSTVTISSDTVDADFTLPTVYSGTIDWTTSDATVITFNEGVAVVTRAAEDKTVTLTASLTIDGKTATKNFELTVKAIDITGKGEVTLKYSGSDNVDCVSGTDYANRLTSNLAFQDIFTVALDKNNAGTTTRLWGNGTIRIYRGGGDGGSITISAKDGKEYIIESIIITLVDTSNNDTIKVTTFDGTVKFNDKSTTTTIEVSEINSKSIKIQNVGTAKNIYISSITVNYKLDICEHETTDVAATEATCTEPATIAHKLCTLCGKKLDADGNVLESVTVDGKPALGHNYNKETDLIAATEATCTDIGYTVNHYHCSRCGYNFDADDNKIEDEVEIPAKGHSFKWAYTTEQHWKECADCHDVDPNNGKTGHAYGDNNKCECGAVEGVKSFTITPNVTGGTYAGAVGDVIEIDDNSPVGDPVKFTITIPEQHTLKSVTLSIEGVTVSLEPEQEGKVKGSFTVNENQLGSATTVNVIVTLEKVMKSWKFATNDNLTDGAKVVVVYNDEKVATGLNSNTTDKAYLQPSASADFTKNENESQPFAVSNAQIFVLEKTGNNWLLKFDGTNNYLSWRTGNYVTNKTTQTNNEQWTITCNETNTVVNNVADPTRVLQYNTSAPRFACYTGSQASIKLYVWC